MATRTQAVSYDDRDFANFKEFVNHYGLNYSKAQYYRKRGKGPKDIISACQFSSASKTELPKETAKRFYCEYNGIQYASLYEAASALGLSPNKVYELRKRLGLSATEAIGKAMEQSMEANDKPNEDTDKLLLLPCKYEGMEYASLYEAASALGLNPAQLYDMRKKKHLSPTSALELAMKKRDKKSTRPSGRAKKCIVDGVEYKSREAAIQAYHIPRITVYSRMEREGISFEEALSRGGRASTYCAPVSSLYVSLRFEPSERPLAQPVLEALRASLAYYNKPSTILRDAESQLPALMVEENTYVFFNYEAKGLELISTLPFPIDTEAIVSLNRSYVSAKFFPDQVGQVMMTYFQLAKEEGQDIRTLLQAYFAYATLREQLCRSFESAQENVNPVNSENKGQCIGSVGKKK